jgi:hypothetical protein
MRRACGVSAGNEWPESKEEVARSHVARRREEWCGIERSVVG